MGQLIRYITKVGPGVENAARDLELHTNHPGTEQWKTLVHLIGYLKSKETKRIVIRNSKVLRTVMFCDSNYATYK